MTILIKFKCWFLGHDYTCKAEQDIAPTKKELNSGISGFFSYSTMYCKRCNYIYGSNTTIQNRYKNENFK